MKNFAFRIFLICLFIMTYTINIYAQSRIIGGSYVDITERPYQAVIMGTTDGINFSFNGGGVIINKNWILTSAHVVGTTRASSIKVGTGNSNYMECEYSIAEKIIISPEYNSTDYTGDVALIKLANPLSFGTNREKIEISNAIYYADNTEATVSGWGVVTNSTLADPSLLLKKADVFIYTESEYFLSSDSTLSDYHSKGDSGSPLTIATLSGDKLIGIVDSTDKISKEKYYVNIGHYLDWIVGEIYDCSISGPDIIGSSGEYTVNVNGDFTVKVDGALQSATINGNTVTVSGSGNGNGKIYVYADGYLLKTKSIWVGAPIIYGIQVDGSYLRLVQYGADQHVTYTSWKIGSNYYTAYNDFIYNPYSSSSSATGSEISVTVTATNKYGTSKPYSTTIQSSGSGHIGVTRIGDTNAFEITSDEAMAYQLVNTSNGSVADNGSIDADGGTLDFSSEQKGLYILRLTTEGNDVSTFKIKVK